MKINPRRHQPPLPLPGSLTREQVLESLISLSIDTGLPGELRSYAETDCDRFLYTLNMVPDLPMRTLEVGANPYFTTILLQSFRKLDLHLTNYFGGPTAPQSQKIVYKGFDGAEVQQTLNYLNINIEFEPLPYPDGHFDLILFCEVIEHMTADPLQALLELKRVLRPDGHLILTTPNVARLENVARLLSGTNLYDPYSGHGPYGRHNREYNRHELHRLLTHCGFQADILFTADVHANAANNYFPVNKFAGLIEFRAGDMGQYLFSRWRNAGPANSKKPSWLYRSYAPEQLDLQPL